MTGRGRKSARFMAVVAEMLERGHLVRFRAMGWSMHPTIRNGEVITIAPLGRAPVRTGDILLYRRGRGAVAHRVVDVETGPARSGRLILQGDAALFCDQPISHGQVLGRVQAVERGGYRVRLGLLSLSWLRALARGIRRRFIS